MSRSIWKGLFCDISINKNNIENRKKIEIWSRQSAIPSFLMDKTVFVHNGKTFKKIIITREKIGYKFGEFAFTKIKAKIKDTNKRKNK
jgi:small subunit ribosomal protein S19